MRIVPCDSALLFSLRGITLHLLNLLATQASQLHRIFHSQQRIESRTHNVMRICRAQHFRAHVPDADFLHDGTYGATRDNASTFRSRLDHHSARAILTDQLVRQSVIDQRHANQVLLRRLDSLFDRERHFARLARAETDVPALVTNHYERREREVLTALNDFSDAIDGDYLIFQVEPLRGNALLGLSHSLFLFLLLRLLFRWRGNFRDRLFCFGLGDGFVLVQARCPGRIRQSLDATMIEIPATIENDLLDTLRERALCDCLTDTARGVQITAAVAA